MIAAAAPTAVGRQARQPWRSHSHTIAVAGIAMMLCFQKPASAISRMGGSADLPALSRVSSQDSAASMRSWPASCGSFMPTKRLYERAMVAMNHSPPIAAPPPPPPSCSTTRPMSAPSPMVDRSESTRPT